MTSRTSVSDVSRETSGFELSLEQKGSLARYHDILASAGIERGLLGPREVDRLWSRHLLNCAAVALDKRMLIPEGSSVIDVGSGAGLPGIVWAIVRPDISVTLVDSLLRRTKFLTEFVEQLEMTDRVDVVRSRAEDLAESRSADVTTARAVAPLDRLLPWLAPLTSPGGRTLALKGATAVDELDTNRDLVRTLGYTSSRILQCGEALLNPPTTVIQLRCSGV